MGVIGVGTTLTIKESLEKCVVPSRGQKKKKKEKTEKRSWGVANSPKQPLT